MKKILFIYLVLFISFIQAHEPLQEHKHKVIVPKDWQPYYKLDENGKPTGFAIEVFEYIAKDIGLDYEYKIVDTWKELWKPFEDGEAHIVPNLGISAKRESFSLFSTPIDTFDIYLFKRFNSHHINTIEDIKNKTVGVVHRNIGQKVMDNYPDIQKEVFNNHFDAINALLSGKIDAFAYPKPLMHDTLISLNIHDKILYFDNPLFEIKRAIGISTYHKELLEPINKSIEKFLASDEYQKIYQKYFGKPEAIEFTKEEIIVYISLILVLIILIISLIFRNKSLITQKQLERKLKENELFLYSIFDESPNISIVTNGSDIIKTNKAMLEFVGYKSLADFKTNHDCICELFLNRKEFLQSKMGDQNWIEYVIDNPDTTHKVAIEIDNTVRYLIVDAKQVKIDQKTLNVLTFSDITELEEVKRRLEFALQGANDGLFDFDMETNEIYFSPRWKEIIGYTDEEISNNYEEWANRVEPHDLEGALKNLDDYIKGKTSFYSSIFKMKHKNGSWVYILARGKLAGDEQRIVGTHSDITNIKLIEKELSENKIYLEDIFNLNPNILFTTTGEKLITSNRMFLDFTGYNSKEDFLKDHECICDFFVKRKSYLPKYQDDGTTWIDYIEQYPEQIHKVLIIKDEKEFVFEVNIKKMPNGEYLILLHEISILEQTQIALERSNEDLQQFAYIASHDLQEPLRMVSSYLQLVERRYKEKLDEDGVDFINFAVDGAKRMQELINGLLQFSRVQTKGSPFETIDTNEVLNDAIENLSISISEKSAIINIESDLPNIRADKRQIIQLFQNIISNSIKYCDTNPKIDISFKEDEENIIFALKDNGIGIDKEYFDKIFLIFQRLHDKSSEYEGTGIGLAVCKRIMQRHGGEIWLESKVGEGTTFYLSFIKKELRNG